MPRIDAPSVAEHHERQRRALLDAARALLAESGETPSMAAVGRRAGLARSSVYQYFSSTQDLLRGVVADVFPDWARQVQERVDAATTPGGRVWAYVEANVALFASSEQAVAAALARVVEPSVLHGPMREFHAQLQAPLKDALAALGEPDVDAMAETIDALVMQATRLEGDPAMHHRSAEEHDRVLLRLRRLIGGYLDLPEAGPT